MASESFEEFDIEFTADGELPASVIEKPTKKASKSSGGRRPTLQQLEKALSAQIKLLGLAASGFDRYDGQIVMDASDDVAEALIEIARVNPKAKRMLESLMTAGAYGGAITTIATKLVLPIVVHHEILPPVINENLANAFEIPTVSQAENEDNGSA